MGNIPLIGEAIRGLFIGGGAAVGGDNVGNGLAEAGDRVGLGLANAGDNMGRAMENSAKQFSHAWSQGISRACEVAPITSKVLLRDAAIEYGDRFYNSVRDMSLIGERTAIRVVPQASKLHLSEAASKLSRAWRESVKDVCQVVEEHGRSISEGFCKDAAKHFQEALESVSKDMQWTTYNAVKKLSDTLLVCTQMVIESVDYTFPEASEKFLIEASLVWSKAWRDTLPIAAQVHLKDAATELGRALIKSTFIACVFGVLVSVIFKVDIVSYALRFLLPYMTATLNFVRIDFLLFLCGVFDFIRQNIMVALLIVVFYQQQTRVMQLCIRLSGTIEKLQTRVSTIEENLFSQKNNLTELRTETVDKSTKEVQQVKTTFTALEKEVQQLKTKFTALESSLISIQGQLNGNKTVLDKIEQFLKDINVVSRTNHYQKLYY